MKISRFLLPPPVLTLFAYARYGVLISPRSEVEWSANFNVEKGVKIASFCKVKSSSGPLSIGSGTEIAPFSFVASQAGGLSIGRDCMIGPSATIVANGYQYDDLEVPVKYQDKTSLGIRIGNDVWIAAGAVILDGAEIGSGSIITPNSVVSGRIPKNSIVQGSPGKVIFTRR